METRDYETYGGKMSRQTIHPSFIGMGTGQSKAKDASASQSRLSDVGRFSLTDKQTANLDILSSILITILRKNNLFELSEVLSNKNCSSLFIMLSSKLNKEFATLRFPEPGKDTLQTVSFIPETLYKTYSESDADRTKNCGTLVFFIIRFVTYVSAVVSSVVVNDKIMTLLKQTDFESLYSPPIDKRFRNIDFSKQLLPPFAPIPMPIISRIPSIKRVDSRYLYTVGNDSTVVIDITRGIVYFAQRGESPVLGITINDASSTAPNTTRSNVRPQYEAPKVPTADKELEQLQMLQKFQKLQELQKLQDLQKLQTTNPALLNYRGGGKTRRNRKQRGGNSAFRVNLRKFGLDAQLGSDGILTRFFMDDLGNTYDVFSERGQGAIPFATRVIPFLESPGLKRIPTMEESGTQRINEFIPISKKADDSFQQFQTTIQKIVGDKEKNKEPELDGTSPAFYRAFLLGSEMDPRKFRTLLCSDIWEGKRLTDIVCYSLLQSLYHDLDDGKMSSTAIKDSTDAVGKFLKENIVSPIEVSSTSTPSGLDSVQFAVAQGASEFCKKTPSATHVHDVDSLEQQKILKSAYDNLRKLYDTHMETVIRLLENVFRLENIGYRQDPHIVLNDVFLKHPQGAQVALDEIIAKGRGILSEHYLQVERVYREAVQKLAK